MLPARIIYRLLDVLSLLFTPGTYSTLSVEMFLFFFSGVWGIGSSCVVFAFVSIEALFIFRIGSSSSYLFGLYLSGEHFTGDNFTGDLHWGLQSEVIDSLPCLMNLFMGEGEFAMLSAYSLALRRGESMICSPDSLSILTLSALFFLLSISFWYYNSTSWRTLFSFLIFYSSFVSFSTTGFFSNVAWYSRLSY